MIKDLLFMLQDAIVNECTRMYGGSVTGEIINSLKENSRSLDLPIINFWFAKLQNRDFMNLCSVRTLRHSHES
jgi:hypothetical protein